MKWISVFVFSGWCCTICAQQSLSLAQCEDLFQKNNLIVIAEQYNLTAAKAAIIQARVWEHPYFTGEINLVNPEDKKVFDAGKNGQKGFAIEQLIYLGGKKRNEIAFAKSNYELASLQFEEVVRTLRLQLAQNFYSLYFDGLRANKLEAQILQLDTLINAYNEQYKKLNVPLRDLVRLQTLSIALKNELLALQNDILESQQNLRVLTAQNEDVIPVLQEDEWRALTLRQPKYTALQLQQMALERNSAYLASLKVVQSNELYYKWQKTMAVPDLRVGAAYDQRGGAFQNQVNLTFGIPLTLWNGNKGNIKMAQANLMQSQSLKENVALELKSKVDNALKGYQLQQTQYANMSERAADLDAVYEGILKNFQRQNISLIEFTDFMESYNTSSVIINDARKQLIILGENLNYLIHEKAF